MLKSSNEPEAISSFQQDSLHEEIVNLLYKPLSDEDCQKYLDPLFVKQLRERALVGIKYIINNLSTNALKMQGRRVPFLLDQQLQEITARSPLGSGNFYVKAQLNPDDKDVNILEYAALAGIPELFHRFSQFGVESEHLQLLIDNVNKICAKFKENQQAQQELTKMLLAMQQSSPQIVKTEVKHTKLQILINNHKFGVALHILLMLLGIAVICVAVLAVENKTDPVVGILIAGGTALSVNALVNIFNIFVNINRQDYVETQRVNRQSLAELANFINNLGISLNWEINTATLIAYNKVGFSPVNLPPQNLPLVAKDEKHNRKLMFSRNNLAGLNTNSETTSHNDINYESSSLRKFSYV